MRISITYDDRAPRDFDTDLFTASEPFRPRGVNVMTEVVPRFDLLFKEEDPVFIIDVYWYDARFTDGSYSSVNDENGAKMFHSQRQVGFRTMIADTSEVGHIVTIEKDGRLVAWRQADDLVDGIKFANQEILCFSSKTTDSINEKAGSIYEYVSNANPGKSKGEVAAMMGYTAAGIDLILSEEFKNKGFADEDDPEAMAEGMAAAYMDARDAAQHGEDDGSAEFDDEDAFEFDMEDDGDVDDD